MDIQSDTGRANSHAAKTRNRGKSAKLALWVEQPAMLQYDGPAGAAPSAADLAEASRCSSKSAQFGGF